MSHIQNTEEEVQRAFETIKDFPVWLDRVVGIMRENPTQAYGDCIVQAEEEFWRRMQQQLTEFIETGAHCDETLRAQFPLFKGYAPEGHPYPEAWRKGARRNNLD